MRMSGSWTTGISKRGRGLRMAMGRRMRMGRRMGRRRMGRRMGRRRRMGRGDAYVPPTEEQEEGESSVAPRPSRKFRRSHTVPPPPVPMTEAGKRVISPVGDR
jgi:hypothetical protein